MIPEWSESKEKRKKRLLSPHLAALAKRALAHADGQCVFVGLYNQHCTAIVSLPCT